MARLTKSQVKGLFEFPQNDRSLESILNSELKETRKGRKKTKNNRRRRKRKTRKDKNIEL
jgi:hypothetical protein